MQDTRNRPDHKHPDYQEMEPILALLQDVYRNLYGRKEIYLPRAEQEPDRAYRERVNRAVFSNRVRPAIESNAGLLTAFELSDLPPSLDEAEYDVDGKGSTIKAFLQAADIAALRDRHCFILVDSPPDGERTAADRLISPIRPRMHLIDRRDVLNWRTVYAGGVEVLEQVTIRMCEQVAVGSFGMKREPRYHVFALVEGGVQHEVLEIREDGVAVLESSVANLPQIPLLCYPYNNSPFGTDLPPFLKASELNIKLFRKESTLDEIEYRVNCPTVWRKSSEALSDRGPVIFGSTWVIELFEGDDVGVLEIAGASIDKLQASIEELKRDLDRETGAFLTSGSTVARTATEAALAAMSLSSTLSGYARAKASAINELISLWCLFTGEENDAEIQQDQSVLEVPLDAQEMQALLALFNAGVLSHETLLELLRMGRQLPPSFDVESELERLAVERGREIQGPALGDTTLDNGES